MLPAIIGCALYIVMALYGIEHKSATYDELVHVTAGYSYWTLGDYRLNPENGNWSQRIVAAPLVAEGFGATAFPSRDQSAWHSSDMWALSDQFFFEPGRNPDSLLLRARAMVVVVGALLGALVFFWSRSLFGIGGACVTMVLYVFSPTLLAHGALATSDMIGAAFFTAALWALWTMLQRVTPFTLAASVFSVGGLFLAKPSAPLFIPIAIILAAAQLWTSRAVVVRLGRRVEMTTRGSRAMLFAALAAVHVVAGYLLIWASYGFRYSAFAPGSASSDSFLDSWASILDTPGVATALAQWGRDHHVLPEAYLYGFATVVAYARDRTSFLNGVVTMGGSHAFFPYAVLYKTTIAGLLLAAAIPVVLARRWWSAPASIGGRRFDLFYNLTPLLVGLVVYGGFAFTSSLNIGHRHLLPLIPATLILAGAVGQAAFGGSPRAFYLWTPAQRSTRRVVGVVAVVTLLAWHAGESLTVAPDYLAYFNEIAGGPSQGYRHLVDSSLDWGQDLPSLKDWLDRNGLQSGSHEPVYLSYFGTALPSAYHIEATSLASFPDRAPAQEPVPLEPGIYCFSATMLQGVYFLTPGPWKQQYETDYQSMIYNLKLFDSTAAIPSAHAALIKQTGEQFWLKNFKAFEHLRTARLATYLRKREPDAQIGHSILVYRVDEDDLAKALYGAAPQ